MTWETVPLGTLIRPARLRRLGSAPVPPLLSMTMQHGLVSQSAKFKKRIAGEDLSQYRVILRGQLVVGFPIDEAVLAFQRLHDRGLVSPAYGVWDVQDERRVDRDYLERYLRSGLGIAYYRAKLRGTTARRRSLPQTVFEAMPVPLPPLAEQRRVAAILDEADALRRERTEAITRLATLPAARFQSYDKSGWERSIVGDVAHLQGGLTVNARRESLSASAPYLRVANVFRGSIDYGELKEIGVTGSELDRTHLKLGDVLVVEGHGNISEVGRAAMIERLPDAPLTHQNHLFRLRPHDTTMTGRFLELAINSPTAREHLKRVANTTSGLNTLNATSLRNLPIKVAPLGVQREIEADFAVASEMLARAQSSGRTLDALFASLQHRAFRGEL